MMDIDSARPALTRDLNATEFLRWYWLKVELCSFARTVGLSATGSKQEVTARIAACLEGKTPPDPPTRQSKAAEQLQGPLTLETVIPPGQRATQVLREFFQREVGSGFRFTGPIRTFIAESQGDRTLGEAIALYQSGRGQKTEVIASQFELNRFTRTFHEQHAGATAKEVRAAWIRYRSLPVDQRGCV
jgi:SAP domain-containing new25/Domain of unknown function (DUF6434)